MVGIRERTDRVSRRAKLSRWGSSSVWLQQTSPCFHGFFLFARLYGWLGPASRPAPRLISAFARTRAAARAGFRGPMRIPTLASLLILSGGLSFGPNAGFAQTIAQTIDTGSTQSMDAG